MKDNIMQPEKDWPSLEGGGMEQRKTFEPHFLSVSL